MTQPLVILRAFFSCRDRKWALAACVLLAQVPARAQAPPPTSSQYRSRATDSLRAVLRRGRAELADTQRTLTYFSLGQEYFLNDSPEALRVARTGLAHARRIGFLRGEYMLLSDLSRFAGDLDDFAQAERWAQELQRRTDQAPPRLHRFRAVALQTMAALANRQNDGPRSRALMQQALTLLLALPQPAPHLELISLYGLSFDYASLVDSHPYPAPDTLVRRALAYIREFTALARSQQRPDLLTQAYLARGVVAAGSPPGTAAADSAAYFFNQSIALSRRLGLVFYEAQAHLEQAQIALQNRRYAPAAAHARTALAQYGSIGENRGKYKTLYVLAEALAAQGQGLTAYRYAATAHHLQDSLDQVRQAATVRTAQIRYDTERKETQIRHLTLRQQVQQAEATRQRQRLWGLSVGLALAAAVLAAVAFLTLRLRRSRTQLTRQNAQLAESRATQDQLYALIAHDLRSPVVAFAGLADLLNFYVHTNNTDRLAGLGGRIRQAAQHLSELLDNLLNWAVSQRGELAPPPRPVRAAELLADTTALYEAAAMAAGVHLSCTAAPDLLVQADPDMTRTILRNLVGNALKASPANGAVSLSAECVAGQVRLLVRDNGGGLSPALLAQLNQPGDAPLRVAETGHRGAGLGLRLSRRFAEAQGGSLVLQNAPQGGAQATLCLPLAS